MTYTPSGVALVGRIEEGHHSAKSNSGGRIQREGEAQLTLGLGREKDVERDSTCEGGVAVAVVHSEFDAGGKLRGDLRERDLLLACKGSIGTPLISGSMVRPPL